MKKILPLILGVGVVLSANAQWTTNGSNDAVNNNTSGKVGIGIVTPAQEALHINGNIRGNQSGALRISTGSGFVDVGPQNPGYSHFNTDRPFFYFNKPVMIDGELTRYGGGNTVRIGSGTSGYVDIGPQNTSYTHFSTDRPEFWFNKPLSVQGRISSYGGDLTLAVNGSNQVTVSQSNGFVGIGTTTPGYALAIQSTSQNLLSVKSPSHAIIDVESGSGLNSYLRFVNNGINKWDLCSETTGNLRVYDYLSSTTRMVITPSGSMGLGTAFPDKLFQIHSSDTPTLAIGKLNNNTNGQSTLQLYAGKTEGSNFYANSFAMSYFKSSSYDRLGFVDGGNVECLSILNGGNVGIGTISPGLKLHIRGQVGDSNSGVLHIDAAGANAILRAGVNTNYSWIQAHGSKPLYVNELGNNTIFNLNGGNVGIGNNNPDAKLTVTGQVHAQEVKVTVNAPGPDYVFEKEYKLTSLEDIKNYIDQNKHLPEVPSAKEMEKNGVQLGEMNMLLLKKIEELTLHVIELKKNSDLEIKLRENEIKDLRMRLETLENKK